MVLRFGRGDALEAAAPALAPLSSLLPLLESTFFSDIVGEALELGETRREAAAPARGETRREAAAPARDFDAATETAATCSSCATLPLGRPRGMDAVRQRLRLWCQQHSALAKLVAKRLRKTSPGLGRAWGRFCSNFCKSETRKCSFFLLIFPDTRGAKGADFS